MFWRPSTEPPNLSRWLLSLLAAPDSRRYLLDDLQDEFERRVDAEGRRAACRFYRSQALASLRPMVLRKLRQVTAERRRPRSLSAPVGWRPRVSVPHDPTVHGAPMKDLTSDLRLALRTCFQQPLPTLLIVLSLGIGIGGSIAAYTLGKSLFFGSEPLDDVVRIYTSKGADKYGHTSAPDYLDLTQDVEAFDRTALFNIGSIALHRGEDRHPLVVEMVSDDYFAITRLQPALGRLPSAEEIRLDGAAQLIVLGYDLWKTEFGSDSEIIGRTVRADGKPFTVVGVGPKDYASRIMGFRVDAWVPIGVEGGIFNTSPGGLADRRQRLYMPLAGLRSGASPAQARAQMENLAERLRTEYPEAWKAETGPARYFVAEVDDGSRFSPQGRRTIVTFFALLGLICGLVLLVGCSNAAGLALARGQRRRREMAVRLSIGASRFRLIRMLLIESALPAAAAGGVGVAVARLLTGLLRTPELPIDLPVGLEAQQDGWVLLVALGLSAVSTVAFGLVPAMESARTDLILSLKGDAVGGSGRGLVLRRVLIVGQVALAVVFVVVAASLTRVATRLGVSDLGFDVDRLAVMSRRLSDGQISGVDAPTALRQMQETLTARAEIEAVAVASGAEGTFLVNSLGDKVIAGDGGAATDGRVDFVAHNTVSDEFFEVLGIPVLQGQSFAQRAGRKDVAVINRAFAERYWPGENAIGRSFSAQNPEEQETPPVWLEVIGVAADGAYVQAGVTSSPFYWRPFDPTQHRWALLVARATASSGEALQVLQREVPVPDGEPILVAPRTYRSMVDAQLASFRLASHWVGGVGALGLFLAVVGIYGLVSFIVGLRQRELAIRQALGATGNQIVLGVAQGGLSLAVIGFVAGLIPALLLCRGLASLAPGIGSFDPPVILISAVLVGAATLWASAWPARRAAVASPGLRLKDS
ncbi:MAG: ABC transporter permease [Acidobacteriota bacterium]